MSADAGSVTERPAAPPWRVALVPAIAGFAVALALRLWTLAEMEADNPLFQFPVLDEAAYLEIAARFGRGESQPHGFYLAPLFPKLLTWLGIGTRHGAGVLDAWLGAVACGLCAGTAAAATRSRVAGWVAAACVALPGAAVLLDVTVATEPLLTLLSLASLVMLAVVRPSPRSYFLGGVLTGLAMLARGNAIAILAATAPTLLRRGTGEQPKRSVLAAALAGGVVLALLPGSLWNHADNGSLSPVAWSGGVNVWLGNNPHAAADPPYGDPGIPPHPELQQRAALAGAAEALGEDVDGGRAGRWWTGRALDWMAENPGTAAEHLLVKAGLAVTHDEFGGSHDAVAEREFATWTRIAPVGTWWVLALGVGGWWLARRRHPWTDRLLLAAAAHFALMIVLFPISRYRLPTLPWFALAAGAGVAVLAAREAPRRRVLQAAAVVGVIAVLAFLPLRDDSRARSWSNIGFAATETGVGDPLPWLERAIDADPELGPPRVALGHLALVSGAHDEALAHFRVAANDAQTARIAAIGAGRAFAGMGNHDQARAVNEDARRRWPSDASLIAEGADLARRAGHLDEAGRLLAEARRINPDEPRVHEVDRALGE